jgi:hypothetical protein
MANLIIVFGTKKVIVIVIIIVRIMKWPVIVLVIVLLGGRQMPVVRWRIGNYENETCVHANNCNKMKELEQ